MDCIVKKKKKHGTYPRAFSGINTSTIGLYSLLCSDALKTTPLLLVIFVRAFSQCLYVFCFLV